MTTTKIWECKIGEVDSVAGGADYPMRQAVAAAYREITGAEPVFIFSGWGALLTEAERAVVENRLPAPATAPEQQECKWTFDDDESNTWASGCGELWSFIDGGPAENRVKYCHWCGKPVVLKDKP